MHRYFTATSISLVRSLLFALLLLTPIAAAAQTPPEQPRRNELASDTPDRYTQLDHLRHAVTRLPVAAGLACVLALRPRRRGTPHRQAPVIQTQIILAVVGSVVMLVVGASLARAFGIVGAAGLVRYRAKIEDPKDAGVMLSTLAIGLATGVGLWLLALFATVFILGLLWMAESFEPKATQLFILKLKAKDARKIKSEVERVLGQHRIPFDLRTSSEEEMHYEVRIPIDKRTERVSDLLMKLDPANMTSVDWEEKKEKK